MFDPRVNLIKEQLLALGADGSNVAGLALEALLLIDQMLGDVRVLAETIDDRFNAINIAYTALRKELRELQRQRVEFQHNISARTHQSANRIMAFEQQLIELAELIAPVADVTQPIPRGDDEQAA